MGCCRQAPPRRRQIAAICANCRASLRHDVKGAIDEAARARGPGTYRVTAELTCRRCRYRNRVPLTFSKH